MFLALDVLSVNFFRIIFFGGDGEVFFGRRFFEIRGILRCFRRCSCGYGRGFFDFFKFYIAGVIDFKNLLSMVFFRRLSSSVLVVFER